nr:hypothetical protein [Erythrobacter sp. SD-21]
MPDGKSMGIGRERSFSEIDRVADRLESKILRRIAVGIKRRKVAGVFDHAFARRIPQDLGSEEIRNMAVAHAAVLVDDQAQWNRTLPVRAQGFARIVALDRRGPLGEILRRHMFAKLAVCFEIEAELEKLRCDASIERGYGLIDRPRMEGGRHTARIDNDEIGDLVGASAPDIVLGPRQEPAGENHTLALSNLGGRHAPKPVELLARNKASLERPALLQDGRSNHCELDCGTRMNALDRKGHALLAASEIARDRAAVLKCIQPPLAVGLKGALLFDFLCEKRTARTNIRSCDK